MLAKSEFIGAPRPIEHNRSGTATPSGLWRLPTGDCSHSAPAGPLVPPFALLGTVVALLGLELTLKAVLQLMVLVLAIVALYEFVYNFIVWNSLITADALKGIVDFDGINVPYPSPKTPWNLVFATKMSLAAFLITAHAFYTMSKQERKRLE